MSTNKNNTNSSTSVNYEHSTLNNNTNNNKEVASIQVYKNENAVGQQSPTNHPSDDSLQLKDNNAARNQPEKQIDIENQKFPYCIVWTKLPCLSVLLPFIGHTGIGTSEGIIHDFSGNYHIGDEGKFAFGAPLKYVQLELDQSQKLQWDKAIEDSDNKFKRTKHQLLSNNCHHHCAYVLNQLQWRVL